MNFLFKTKKYKNITRGDISAHLTKNGDSYYLLSANFNKLKKISALTIVKLVAWCLFSTYILFESYQGKIPWICALLSLILIFCTYKLSRINYLNRQIFDRNYHWDFIVRHFHLSVYKERLLDKIESDSNAVSSIKTSSLDDVRKEFPFETSQYNQQYDFSDKVLSELPKIRIAIFILLQTIFILFASKDIIWQCEFWLCFVFLVNETYSTSKENELLNSKELSELGITPSSEEIKSLKLKIEELLEKGEISKEDAERELSEFKVFE